jgi:hypothetical protein
LDVVGYVNIAQFATWFAMILSFNPNFFKMCHDDLNVKTVIEIWFRSCPLRAISTAGTFPSCEIKFHAQELTTEILPAAFCQWSVRIPRIPF